MRPKILTHSPNPMPMALMFPSMNRHLLSPSTESPAMDRDYLSPAMLALRATQIPVVLRDMLEERDCRTARFMD